MPLLNAVVCSVGAVIALWIFIDSSQAETIDVLGCKLAYGNSCAEISFYVVTRSNPEEPQLVNLSNVTTSHYDSKRPTKLIIHGYASGMNLDQLVEIRNEYLAADDYNILVVQYLDVVDSPCYPMAVLNIRYAAPCMSKFIHALIRQGLLAVDAKEVQPKVVSLHIVAFSLGAQTAAFIANHLKPEYIVHRISGLDPALPLFLTNNSAHKLTQDDAVRVDVIHTNAYFQGKAERCGHVDFYMNGGVNQPGCSKESIFRILKCDHHRAPTYFAESIRSEQGFWGWPCTSIEDYQNKKCPPTGDGVLMGDRWDQNTTGFYVVDTANTAPFARGRWWLKNDSEYLSSSTRGEREVNGAARGLLGMQSVSEPRIVHVRSPASEKELTRRIHIP